MSDSRVTKPVETVDTKEIPVQKASETEKKKPLWPNFLYILAIIVVMVIILLRDENLDNVSEALSALSLPWFLLGVICSVGHLVAEGFAFYYTIRWICPGSKFGYFRALKTALVGQFYSAITPSSTGGQPMQVVDMYQNGLSVGHGTSVVMVRFVTHEAAIFLFTFLGFVTQYQKIAEWTPSFILFGIIGVAMALICIALVVSATFSSRLTDAVFRLIVKIACGLHLCRDREKLENQLADTGRDFHDAGLYLKHHPVRMVVLTLFDVAFFIFYFSITYCLYRAFGLTELDYFTVILLQAFMHSMVYFFPLPGASGASEGSFVLLFRHVFGSSLVFSVMLFWRLLTYYSKLIFGSGAILAGSVSQAVKKKKATSEG